MPMKKESLAKTLQSPKFKEYTQTLADIKKHIKEAQIKAALSANKELLKLYWYIGKRIAEKQNKNNWGSSIIEKLAEDLGIEFRI